MRQDPKSMAENKKEEKEEPSEWDQYAEEERRTARARRELYQRLGRITAPLQRVAIERWLKRTEGDDE